MFRRIAHIENMTTAAFAHDAVLTKISSAAATQSVGGNTGNVAYVEGLRSTLASRPQPISWQTNESLVRGSYDKIVVSCANQLGLHFDLDPWADVLEKFELPFVLIGLGAQANDSNDTYQITKSARRLMDMARERSPEASPVGVRGTFTQRVLEKNGYDSVVIGCPSVFTNAAPGLGIEIERRASSMGTRAVVAGGNPHDLRTCFYEERLLALVNAGGGYVVQHPADMVAFARWDASLLPDEFFNDILPRLIPGFDKQEALEWARTYAHAFFDGQTWMQYLSRFDFCIGARFHGVMLAAQAGIPGLVLSHDSRLSELCDATGLPSRPIEDIHVADPRKLVQDAWVGYGQQFDRRRSQTALVMRQFLLDHKLGPSLALDALAGQI